MARIQSLGQECPYTKGTAIKKERKKKKNNAAQTSYTFLGTSLRYSPRNLRMLKNKIQCLRCLLSKINKDSILDTWDKISQVLSVF